MKTRALILLLLLINLLGCDGGSEDPRAKAHGAPAIAMPLVAGDNVLAIHVGGCGVGTYLNEPCVTLTLCVPGTEQCQTIPNVLLDTGSFGLRLFSAAVQIPLVPQVDSNGKTLAECAQFGTGAEWGKIARAEVRLGGEPGVEVPIQLIDSHFATPPASCQGLETSPQASGFNGILGVGLFVQDCGKSCTTAQNDIYYSCAGAAAGAVCESAAVPIAEQVANPVAALPVDNNGVVVQLPAVPAGGVSEVTGNLILGIGTQANNHADAANLISADDAGDFVTEFNGRNFNMSFIDSGSNGLFFPNPSALEVCRALFPGFYCPSSPLVLSATQVSATSRSAVAFSIANTETTVVSGNLAAADVAGSIVGPLALDFDWGLPFFYGRTVYVGFRERSSPLASGGYWAY